MLSQESAFFQHHPWLTGVSMRIISLVDFLDGICPSRSGSKLPVT